MLFGEESVIKNFIKFGIVGDVHISDNPPSTRKDDYRTTVLNKLNFIVDYANDHNYRALFFLGDLFHKKIPFHNSHTMISALITLFSGCKCPVYVVPGNHDIHGNMSSFEGQPLNVLVKSGVVQIFDGIPVVFATGKFICSVNGAEYLPARDSKENTELYQLAHCEESNYKISMFHQMILPDDKRFFSNFVNFKDLKDLPVDLVCCGHYHDGYQPALQKYSDSISFLNPGSITRGTSEQSNLDKKPKFTELILENDSLGFIKSTFTDVEIPFLPADQVFDFTVIERNHQKKDMHQFMDGLSEMESQSLSTQDPVAVLNVLKTMGLPDNLSETAFRYLGEAHAELT